MNLGGIPAPPFNYSDGEKMDLTKSCEKIVETISANTHLCAFEPTVQQGVYYLVSFALLSIALMALVVATFVTYRSAVAYKKEAERALLRECFASNGIPFHREMSYTWIVTLLLKALTPIAAASGSRLFKKAVDKALKGAVRKGLVTKTVLDGLVLTDSGEEMRKQILTSLWDEQTVNQALVTALTPNNKGEICIGVAVLDLPLPLKAFVIEEATKKMNQHVMLGEARVVRPPIRRFPAVYKMTPRREELSDDQAAS